jgi:early secretory antigenic target protein ESAT-6
VSPGDSADRPGTKEVNEMALDGLRVNHAGLDAAAQDLATTVKQIDERLNRLESELAPLRSDWTGSAQQSYQVAKTKWDTAMQDMKNLLADTSTTVHQSNADYRAADQRGAASFEF